MKDSQVDIVLLLDPLGDQLALLLCQDGLVAENFALLLNVHGHLEGGVNDPVASEDLTCG